MTNKNNIDSVEKLVEEARALLGYTINEINEVYQDFVDEYCISHNEKPCTDDLKEFLEKVEDEARKGHKKIAPKAFKEARYMLNATQKNFGIMLGMKKSENTKIYVNRLENGSREISNLQSRMVRAYLSRYKPLDWPEEPAGRWRARDKSA